MPSEINRREFVKDSVVASAGAALGAAALNQSAQGAEADPPAATDALPKGKIGDLEISRLLLGGNLLTHYTHSRDLRYVNSLAKHYNTPEKILETLAVSEQNGINTLTVHDERPCMEILKEHRRRGGKMQWITCSFHKLSASWQAQEQQIQELVDDGTDSLYISGVDCDNMWGQQKVDLIGKAVDAAKFHGVTCGIGAHKVEVIVECEKAKFDNDFYVKTFHHHTYPSAKLDFDSMWCYKPEDVIQVMKDIEKPWIAFKVMAAGAIPPQDAFQYAFDNGADFVLAGMFDYEVAEDVRIAREALAKCKRTRPWRA